MYSFIKKYTETMQDVGVLWYVKVLDNKQVDKIKNLPIEQ